MQPCSKKPTFPLKGEDFTNAYTPMLKIYLFRHTKTGAAPPVFVCAAWNYDGTVRIAQSALLYLPSGYATDLFLARAWWAKEKPAAFATGW